MWTSADHREAYTLASGERVTLRFIRPDDADALRAAFAQLSPQSRYSRFFMLQSALSDEAVRYLTDVDGTNHVAIVATIESNDLRTERGIGVARFVRLRDEPHVAEAAVTVVDAYQGQGIGRLLVAALAQAALARGVTTFRATVLPSNARMIALLTELGAVAQRIRDGVVELDVPLGPAADVADRESPLRRLLRAAAQIVSALPLRHG